MSWRTLESLKTRPPPTAACFRIVIPAEAGIQVYCRPAELAWIPAFAGMTELGECAVVWNRSRFSKEAQE